MFAVRNSTRYQAHAAVLTDKDGRDVVVVVAKATFAVSHAGEVTVAPEQAPLIFADEFWDDPAVTSLKAASDMVLFKPHTDVVVIGSAHAPRGRPIARMEVELRVGPLAKKLAVVGNRSWVKGVSGPAASDPEPFEQMPLLFERAFGGRCVVAGKSQEEKQEDRNPVGAGFWSSAEQAADKPLPNLEDPAAPIGSWKDRPEPRGFGYVCGHWQPRRDFAGTYDARWEKERMPLLPDDFDYRYFNVAPTDQQVVGRFAGGEEVALHGMTPDGVFYFRLPADEIDVNLLFPMENQRSERAVLDTIVIQPDLRQFQMVWRLKTPAPDPITHLLHIDVTSRLNRVVHPEVWPEQELA